MAMRRKNFSTFKLAGTDDVVVLDFNQDVPERAASFPCSSRISGITLVEFISQMDDENPTAVGGAVITFLKSAVKPQYWEDFLAYTRNPENGVELEELVDVCSWLAEQYTSGNPTQLSSPSSPGSPASGPGPEEQHFGLGPSYGTSQPTPSFT